MNDSVDLEREYRRLMRWYPADFRSEYEPELVGVLMAAASPGQQRPTADERLDLMVSGIWTRLRPSVPQSAHSVLAGVRLMYVGALVDLAALVVAVSTLGLLRSNAMASNPNFSEAKWQNILGGLLIPHLVAGALAVGFWVWMAWANGRGREWARQAFAGYFVLSTLSFLAALLLGVAVYAPADLAALVVLWLLQLSIVLLIFNKRSDPYYTKRDGTRARVENPEPVRS